MIPDTHSLTKRFYYQNKRRVVEFEYDNKILNYEESILKLKNITATNKFIDFVESEFDRKNKKEEELNFFHYDLPF